MPESNMSLRAADIDKSVVIGTLTTISQLSDDDCIPVFDVSDAAEPRKKATVGAVKEHIGGVLPHATAIDAGKPVIVGQNGAFTLGQTATATENFFVSASDWQALTNNDPYLYYADKQPTNSLGANAEVELINNDPATFAKYGLAVLPVLGTTVRFAAVQAPLSAIVMRCKFYA